VWYGQVFGVRNVELPAPRESFSVSFSKLRVEQRRRPPPQRHIISAPVEMGSMAPPLPATLALPHGWSRQDFGFLETTDTAEWIDWTNQTAKWVPRVFLWRFKAKEGYMRSVPSLHDTIADILSTLRNENAKVFVSRAQTVCNGQRSGWFLSYIKTMDDPPLQFDETLFVDGENIYRATYIRVVGQREDSKTREALNTLCT
jgi:hypothetical protein